jgi:hypothetical protein
MFWEVVGLERGPLSIASTTEELLATKSNGCCLENREYGRRWSFTLTTWHPLSPRVGINFPDKLRPLGRCSSLADSGHGVCFIARTMFTQRLIKQRSAAVPSRLSSPPASSAAVSWQNGVNSIAFSLYGENKVDGQDYLLAVHLKKTARSTAVRLIGVVLEKTKLHGLSPRAKYTDRAAAACRRSDCQLVRIEGTTWSA